MELSEIQTAADRAAEKAAAEAALSAAAKAAAEAAAKVAATEAHWTNVICRWACAAQDDDRVREDELVIPIESDDIMPEATRDAFETDLVARGYTVTRDAATRKFTVSMP